MINFNFREAINQGVANSMIPVKLSSETRDTRSLSSLQTLQTLCCPSRFWNLWKSEYGSFANFSRHDDSAACNFHCKLELEGFGNFSIYSIQKFRNFRNIFELEDYTIWRFRSLELQIRILGFQHFRVSENFNEKKIGDFQKREIYI